jgi:cell division protease FtsH
MPTLDPKPPGSMPPVPPVPPGAAAPDPRRNWRMFLVLAAMIFGMWFWKANTEPRAERRVPYSQFYTWAEQGKVRKVSIMAQRLEGELAKPETVEERTISSFQTTIPTGDDALLPLLRSKGVQIDVADRQQPFAVEVILTLLPWALIIGVWIWISRRAQSAMGGPGGPFGLARSRGRKFDKTTSVQVTFNDIAGLKAAKRDLQEIVEFLKEPERFRKLGSKVPRGVLLVGPPGTGKTLLARAVAGESGVPFYSVGGSEFIEMFVGLGAARVRELFAEVKKSAPAIVFIDEIDAVGRARSAGMGVGHDEREQTLNQLLAEMDGFERNDLVVVLAATNRPDVLDPALLRPGRFDRRVVVDRPELTRGKPVAPDVDLQRIAEQTPGFSGADLANLVNEAALHATRVGRDAITAEDFSAAYDKIVLGDPREAKLDEQEKRRVAIHEAGHTLVAHVSPGAAPPHRVSIIPRGMALGVTHAVPPQERHLMTESEIAARLRVFMGGYAAERLVLGEVSTGAENDLKEATRLASSMVAHYGMSRRLGPVHYDHRSEHPFLGGVVAGDGGTSPATISTIEEEARQILSRALDEATACLTGERAVFDSLVDALLREETLERHELEEILRPARERPISPPAAPPPDGRSAAWRPGDPAPPRS